MRWYCGLHFVTQCTRNRTLTWQCLMILALTIWLLLGSAGVDARRVARGHDLRLLSMASPGPLGITRRDRRRLIQSGVSTQALLQRLRTSPQNPLLEQPNLSSGPSHQVARVEASPEPPPPPPKPGAAITKPDYLKPEWCNAENLKQIVRERGCLKRKIRNKFCYGQCNSFVFPKSDSEESSPPFISCAYCKPKKFKWTTIRLRCPRKRPYIRKKRIQLIERCKCMTDQMPWPTC